MLFHPFCDVVLSQFKSICRQEGLVSRVWLDGDDKTLVFKGLIIVDIVVVVPGHLMLHMSVYFENCFAYVFGELRTGGPLEEEVVDPYHECEHPRVRVDHPPISLHHLRKEVNLLTYMHGLSAHGFNRIVEFLLFIGTLVADTCPSYRLVKESHSLWSVFIVLFLSRHFLDHLFWPSSIVREPTFTLQI